MTANTAHFIAEETEETQQYFALLDRAWQMYGDRFGFAGQENIRFVVEGFQRAHAKNILLRGRGMETVQATVDELTKTLDDYGLTEDDRGEVTKILSLEVELARIICSPRPLRHA